MVMFNKFHLCASESLFLISCADLKNHAPSLFLANLKYYGAILCNEVDRSKAGILDPLTGSNFVCVDLLPPNKICSMIQC